MTTNETKAALALDLIHQLEAETPLGDSDARSLAEMLKARAVLETFYDAVVGGRRARARLAVYREKERVRSQTKADEKAVQAENDRLVAEAQAFDRLSAAATSARARGLFPPKEDK